MSFREMTVAGAVIILTVTVIRALAINKLPKKTFVVLWGVAVLRLLIPFSLPSALSVYSLMEQRTAETVNAAPLPSGPSGNAVLQEGMSARLGARISDAPSYNLSINTVILILGAFICLAFFARSYLKLRERFNGSLPVDNPFVRSWLAKCDVSRHIEIRHSDEISAPLTYGILRPVILMPKSTDWEDENALKYVLAHELVHIRRFDAISKLFLTAAVCVHWFNPAVWLMYVLANRDIELSCDESVLRSFGEASRSDYALTLISMEEVKSGLSPLYNHFSREAIEERIVAIMKFKKATVAAVTAAVMLVVGVTVAFATSEKEPTIEEKDRAANALAGNFDVETTMSYCDPENGKTYFSWDEGKNWISLTDEEYMAMFPEPDVEWWTAEEYADWLENEKLALQDMIGSKGWTASRGWFTWTQKDVDDAIALYERILEDIRNGIKVSKTVDGSEETMLAMGTGDWESYAETQADNLERASLEERRAHWDEILKDYIPFGVSCKYDESTDEFRLYYKGEEVRSIYDSVKEVWLTEHQGISSYPEGARELYAVYDGSKLTGLRPATDEEMTMWDNTRRSYTLGAEWIETGCDPDLFSEYEKFGLVFDTRDCTFYYNGELVRYFNDSCDLEDGLTVTRYEYYNEDGTIDLHAVHSRKYNADGSYDPFGDITEIWEYTEPVVIDEAVMEETAVSSAGFDMGESFQERFAKYKDFGITYVEDAGSSGKGNVYLNGKLVGTFSDKTPYGGAFSFQSSKSGGKDAYVVYDSDGKMTGVEFK